MPREIHDQIVVITGASSGIGRTTARMFAEHGARVVVGSRNAEALGSLVKQITESGGLAYALPTDVTDRAQVERLAEMALNYFGRIDTWVNNAGVSMYATFDKMTDAEIRRIMEVNFMGTVHGIQAALPVMRAHGGGTIINVASVAGKRAIPLQSVYSASKYAIVGLGEALRAELLDEPAEVHVCTVCPPSIDTPFFDHAATKEGYAAKPLPPVYEPETVAEAIIDCAGAPAREVVIGMAGKAFAVMNTLAPAATDWFMSKTGISEQLRDEPKSAAAPSNLFDTVDDAREHGGWNALGRRSTAQPSAMQLVKAHPLAASLAGVAVAALAARLLMRG
ncbi:MAG TPA: SDR family oxidoreductase [Blastocatellia bacterium]|nr:SDR family oxidoreductase [Blastocatellia bacterium]